MVRARPTSASNTPTETIEKLTLLDHRSQPNRFTPAPLMTDGPVMKSNPKSEKFKPNGVVGFGFEEVFPILGC